MSRVATHRRPALSKQERAEQLLPFEVRARRQARTTPTPCRFHGGKPRGYALCHWCSEDGQALMVCPDCREPMPCCSCVRRLMS